MNIDELKKDVQAFERMTRAVLEVASAVEDGMLKSQRIKELDNMISEKQKQIDDIDNKIFESNNVLEELKVTSDDKRKSAENEAKIIVARAKEDALLLTAAAERKLQDINSKINSSEKAFSEKLKEISDLDKEIAQREKAVEDAKEKIRGLLD